MLQDYMMWKSMTVQANWQDYDNDDDDEVGECLNNQIHLNKQTFTQAAMLLDRHMLNQAYRQ